MPERTQPLEIPPSPQQPKLELKLLDYMPKPQSNPDQEECIARFYGPMDDPNFINYLTKKGYKIVNENGISYGQLSRNKSTNTQISESPNNNSQILSSSAQPTLL